MVWCEGGEESGNIDEERLTSVVGLRTNTRKRVDTQARRLTRTHKKHHIVQGLAQAVKAKGTVEEYTSSRFLGASSENARNGEIGRYCYQ